MPNRVLKNIIWNGLLQVSNLVLPLITIPIIARTIGPEKLGLINYAGAVVAYFTLIIGYSFELTATRQVVQYRDDPAALSRLFSTVFYAKLLLLAGSTALFALAYALLPQFRADARVAVFSYLIVLSFVVTPNFLFQGMEHLKHPALFNLASKVLFTIAVLLLIRREADYFWQPLALSISQVVAGLWAFGYAMRAYGLRLTRFEWKEIRENLREGQTVFYMQITMNLYTTSSIVILGLFQSAEQVGQYTAANRLIIVAQGLLFTPVHNSLFPYIGHAFARNREAGLDAIRQAIPFAMGFTALYCLGIFIASPWLIRLIYGEAFEPAIRVLRILSVVPFLVNCNSFFGIQTMINLKMDRDFFRVTAWAAVLGVVLNVGLALLVGYLGTAVALVLIEVFICLSLYYRLRQEGISLFDSTYANPRYMLGILRAQTGRLRGRL